MSKLKVNEIESYSGTTITIDTDTVFNKNVTVSGNLILGDADTDSIDFNADIVSNIIPNATNTYDIGSSTKRWKDLYISGAASFASLGLTGDLDVDGIANLDNTDIDGTLVVDGSNISLDSTSTLNIDNSNTSNGITIGTATSGVPISIGHTTSETTINDNFNVTGQAHLNSDVYVKNVQNGFTSNRIWFRKARSGSHGILNDGDQIGSVTFQGADGASDVEGATIQASVSGTPASGSVPTRLTFSTNGGSAAATKRMIIHSNGNVGIGDDSFVPAAKLGVDGGINLTGSLNFDSSSVTVDSIIDDDTMASASATALATSESIKAYIGTYVASAITAEDLDFQGDSGGALSIDLDSEVLSIVGGTGVTTAGSGNQISVATDAAQGHVTSVGTLTSLNVSGNTAIGVASAEGILHTADNSGVNIFQRSNDSASYGTNFYIRKSRGTVGSEANVGSGDMIGQMSFSAYYGDFDNQSASISSKVEGTLAADTTPGSLIFSTTAAGANTVTERMRIDSSGNVGVGTDAPLQPLHVYSNNNNSDPTLLIDNDNAAGTCGIGFLSGTSDNYTIGVAKVGTNFRIANGTNLSSAPSLLDIDRDTGSVGIGIDAPTQKLHVNTPNDGEGIKAENASTGAAFEAKYISGAGNGYQLKLDDNNNDTTIFLRSYGNSYFNTGGNFGIGTTSPEGILHTANNSGTNIFQRSNNSATYGTNFYIRKSRGTVGSEANVSSGDMIGQMSFSAYYGDYDNQSASISSKVEGTLAADTTPGNLIFSTTAAGANAVTERMRIDSGGNVGIGTDAPHATARLHVHSTTSGFLPPRLTETQRNAISTPAPGLLIFNTTSNKLECWDGTSWQACF